MEGIMTPASIQERIDCLQDDSMICQMIMNNPTTPMVEKAECRMRSLANAQEIMCLKSTLIILKSDPVMRGQ